MRTINMKYIFFFPFLSFFLVYNVSMQAQQRVLDLKSCLEIGLENNYSLRVSRNDEQISKNNVTLANAGYLPILDVSGSSQNVLNSTDTKVRATGETNSESTAFDQTFNVGLNLNWTIFDGFKMTANYERLKELEKQGEINTRLAIEDFIADFTAEYYNNIQQKIRLKNFHYAVSLSKERLRIVEARYTIGDFSRLDLQQARVDFNADSSSYMKQQERLQTSHIRLNELMAYKDVNRIIATSDSIIDVNTLLDFDELWESTLRTNASILKAERNNALAELDLKNVYSRNYPYVRLSSGYGYTLNNYGTGVNSHRNNLGFNAGITVGFNIFDGNRKRERTNANIAIANARLRQQELEQSLRADINNLWQAYCNNIQMLKLERENLVAAKENHDIARERYLLGDLSGIAMREAQKSLLDAEERILTAEYNTKLCEISLLQISGRVVEYVE
ncbi:Outer membrane efflux protein BepC [termite gut metagenome]|uniref:Outer membrane efflux protein BepC n=1 Tax=termite gut metagenome TaxID=433724 RepID=A0A5J4RYX9_9ZZZZ